MSKKITIQSICNGVWIDLIFVVSPYICNNAIHTSENANFTNKQKGTNPAYNDCQIYSAPVQLTLIMVLNLYLILNLVHKEIVEN